MRIIFFNTVGCILTIIGAIFVISYLNMLDIGYSITEYFYFIFHRLECLCIILGIMILVFNNIHNNNL